MKTFKFSFSWFVTSRRGCEPSVKSFLFPLFDVKSQVYNKLELTFKCAEFHFEVEHKQRVSSILKYLKLQCSTRLLSTSGHAIKANKLMWIKYELNVHLLFAKRRSFEKVSALKVVDSFRLTLRKWEYNLAKTQMILARASTWLLFSRANCVQVCGVLLKSDELNVGLASWELWAERRRHGAFVERHWGCARGRGGGLTWQNESFHQIRARP